MAWAARDLTAADVVQMRVFRVGMKDTLPACREAAADFFDDVDRPSMAAVAVTELVAPNLLLEIELVAVGDIG